MPAVCRHCLAGDLLAAAALAAKPCLGIQYGTAYCTFMRCGVHVDC